MTARRARDLFVIAFLAIQLALPLRVLWRERADSRGHFSWNMYSRAYRCDVGYQVLTPEGRVEAIDHRDYVARRRRASMLFYRDVLPRFHAELCDQLRADGQLGTLRGSVSCITDNQGSPDELIRTNEDLCTADNYGVDR